MDYNNHAYDPETIDMDNPREPLIPKVVTGGAGVDQLSIQTQQKTDLISSANNVLRSGNLPDIDTIISHKAPGLSQDLKNLYAAVVVIEKPQGEQGLNKSIIIYNKLANSGVTYDEFVSKDIKTKEQLERFFESDIISTRGASSTSIKTSTLPSVPTSTPGVEGLVQNRIDLRLQSIGIDKEVDHNKFEITDRGGLKVKTSSGEYKHLTQSKDPSKFLVDPDVSAQDIQDLFGINKKTYQDKIRVANGSIAAPEEFEMAERQTKEVLEVNDQITQTSFAAPIQSIEHNQDQISQIAKNTGLSEREVRGLDEAAQTLKGNIKIQTSKLISLEQEIERERAKDSPDTDKINRLENEKQTTLDSLNILRDRSNGQIESIRETIRKIKDGEMTIWERIKLIFKEQGITISAIITAVGLIIGMIVSVVTGVSSGGGAGGGAGGGSGGGDGPKPSDDSIVKKGLKKVANWLKSLADKALAALPGIIGTIVSTLLKTGAAVVSFFADNLIAFVAAVGIVIWQVFIKQTKVGRKIEDERKHQLKTRQKNN